MNEWINKRELLEQIDIDSDGEPGYYGDTWKFIDTINNMPVRSDLISRCELFNLLATIQAPPEANDFKAEVYKIIQQMETEKVEYREMKSFFSQYSMKRTAKHTSLPVGLMKRVMTEIS